MNLFSVVSWGRAATHWLSRGLNSHPDIFCVNAGNDLWRTVVGGQRIDGTQYMRLIELMGENYAAAGEIHGISRNLIPEIRAAFGDRFEAVVLVREPLKRFTSQLAMYEKMGRPHHWNLDYTGRLIDRYRLALPAPSSYSDRFVVHAANMLNAILEEALVGTIYRMEDITTSSDALGRMVTELTHTNVSLAGSWLKAVVGNPPVNLLAANVGVPAIADWQIDILRRVVSARAWELYTKLGYQQPAILQL